MTTIAPPLARGIRIMDAAANMSGRLAASIAAELRCRRAIRHLRQMDDHILADIGVSRREIASAVSGHRYR